MTGNPGVATVRGPKRLAPRLALCRAFEGLPDHNSLWYTLPPPVDDACPTLVEDSPPTIVRVYRGSQQSDAVRIFDKDAAKLAPLGYEPTRQSWEAGRWGWRAFMVELLFAVILVGLLMFVYMLVVRPEGTLTVTYTRRDAPPASGI